MTKRPVVGIDAMPKGWVAVLLARDRVELATDRQLENLIGRFPDAAAIAIDMPIGVPEVSHREADVQARAFVGPRRHSVFMTPPGAVLDAPTHRAASDLATEMTGKGVSQQAYALGTNIRIVNALAAEDSRIIEVHPEVSFCALVGRCLQYPKGSWNGHAIRRAALAGTGIALPDDLGDAGLAPSIDVLDAAVAAWSACRYALGQAESFPGTATPGDHEVIWY